VAYKRYLRLKYFFTPLLTMLLAVMMIYSITVNGADRYRMLILLSLLMALSADTLMMIEEISLLKNGMIFFIAGHVFYAGAFSINVSFEYWNLALILILAVLNLLYFRVLIKTASKMFIPVTIYVLLLDSMVYFAVTRLNHDLSSSAVFAASGAVLFMISDFILSVNAFIKPIPKSTVFTWLLYAPAQYLIVLSTFQTL